LTGDNFNFLVEREREREREITTKAHGQLCPPTLWNKLFLLFVVYFLLVTILFTFLIPDKKIIIK
jgi:hypothetical protein